MVVGFCILLALILPSAYDEMKEGWKHRVIPNSRTLRDYRNDTYPKDKPGVNYELKNVRKSFSGIQRLMCLCFDKIKIQGSLVFIKYVDELIGFTDLGVSDTRYSTLSNLDKSATHILVYCARGLCCDFKFAFAFCSTHGTTFLRMILLNYVPYVLPSLKCPTPYVLSPLTFLVPCVLSCLTCLEPCVHLCLICLVPYVFSCLTCLTNPSTSRVLFIACSCAARASYPTCSCAPRPSRAPRPSLANMLLWISCLAVFISCTSCAFGALAIWFFDSLG